jgi:hypothetical protein
MALDIIIPGEEKKLSRYATVPSPRCLVYMLI